MAGMTLTEMYQRDLDTLRAQRAALQREILDRQAALSELDAQIATREAALAQVAIAKGGGAAMDDVGADIALAVAIGGGDSAAITTQLAVPSA